MAEVARPRQVTVAGWSIVIGSVLVVLSAWEQVSGIHTLQTREMVEEMLADSPAAALLSVPQMLEVMRVLAMVAAGCATACAALGWQALKRSRQARLWLTVLAVPLFFAGLGGGGFFVGLVAAGVMMLWLQPARDWFNGLSRTEAAAAAVFRTGPPSEAPHAPQPPHPSQPPADASSQPAPWGAPTQQSAQPFAPHAVDDRRPAPVMLAALLTWVSCALSVVAVVLSAVVTLRDPATLLEEMERSYPGLTEEAGYTEGMVEVAVLLMCGALAMWALAAMALAWLALRRHDWARICLIVSAACAGVFMLIGTFTMPAMLVPLVACGATIMMLLRPEVAAWFSRKR